MAIDTYFDQLNRMAAKVSDEQPDRVLRRAFGRAGVPSSTYYRAKHGTDLKGKTAKRVADALTGMGSSDGARNTAQST